MKYIAPISHSLLSKILFFALIFTISMTMAIGTAAYFISIEGFKQAARDKLSAVSIVKENDLNRWVDEQRGNIVLFTAMPEIRGQAGILDDVSLPAADRAAASQALNKYFRTIVSTASDIQEILLLDKQGKILVSSIPSHVGIDQRSEPYFTYGLTQTWITPFYTSPLLNTSTITLSAPLFGNSGRRVGVLAIHLSLKEVDRIITENNQFGTTVEVYLIDPQRQLVTADPLARQNGLHRASLGIDAALSGQSGSGIYTNERGVAVIGAYRWIQARGVALIVEISQQESLGAVYNLGHWISLIGLAIAVSSNLLILLFASRALGPIETLTQTAQKIARGDLSLRVPVNSADEVGKLGQAFNTMTSELQKTLEGLEDLNDKLEARVEERTAALKRSNRELESFSYSVSHDLRAPLRALSGYSRMLTDQLAGSLEPEPWGWLQYIQENAVFMGKMLDGLLAFSRLGSQSIRPQQISAPEMTAALQHIIATLKVSAPYEQTAVQVGDLDACYADPLLLNQVFTNLVSNAFKFSQRHPSPMVDIGCVNTERGRAYFVRDNGVGFDMRFAEKLFGVFQRLHRQDEFEGTGVGLAIVQNIIRRHNGEIWVQSEPGRGAAFYFTLKLEPGEENDFPDSLTRPDQLDEASGVE